MKKTYRDLSASLGGADPPIPSDGPCPRWLARLVGQFRSGPGQPTHTAPRLIPGTTTRPTRRDANQTAERRVSSPWPSGPGRPGGDRRRSKPARVAGRGLEAIRLHYAGRVDEREDGEDDALGERSPGRAKACEAGVNRCQIV
jgi:hypothetical protein